MERKREGGCPRGLSGSWVVPAPGGLALSLLTPPFDLRTRLVLDHKILAHDENMMSALAPQALLEGRVRPASGGMHGVRGALGGFVAWDLAFPRFPPTTPLWSLHCKQKWSDHLVCCPPPGGRLPHTKDYVTKLHNP